MALGRKSRSHRDAIKRQRERQTKNHRGMQSQEEAWGRQSRVLGVTSKRHWSSTQEVPGCNQEAMGGKQPIHMGLQTSRGTGPAAIKAPYFFRGSSGFLLMYSSGRTPGSSGSSDRSFHSDPNCLCSRKLMCALLSGVSSYLRQPQPPPQRQSQRQAKNRKRRKGGEKVTKPKRRLHHGPHEANSQNEPTLCT